MDSSSSLYLAFSHTLLSFPPLRRHNQKYLMYCNLYLKLYSSISSIGYSQLIPCCLLGSSESRLSFNIGSQSILSTIFYFFFSFSHHHHRHHHHHHQHHYIKEWGSSASLHYIPFIVLFEVCSGIVRWDSSFQCRIFQEAADDDDNDDDQVAVCYLEPNDNDSILCEANDIDIQKYSPPKCTEFG